MRYLEVNMPYLILGLALVILAVVFTLRRAQPFTTENRARLRSTFGRAGIGVLASLVGVVILTAVFDNVIILTGVVDYNHSLTSGMRIGVAPIEDFAYSIFAAVALPAVWLIVPPRRRG